MKILLIQPPIEDFYDTEIRLQPLGLCMLKSAVKKHLPGLEIAVRDFHQGFGRRTVPIPPGISYLGDYYGFPDRSPFSSFHRYYRFGASLEEIGRSVAEERPQFVGISSLFSPYHGEALACAGEIKRRLGVPVIMGGSHVSCAPGNVLSDPLVDFIIRGEGERPLVEFLKAFLSGGDLHGVPNLGFKEGGKPILNPVEDNYPIEDLPFADFSDLGTDRYLFEGKPLCFITTTRGCPHLCTFCSVHLTFGHAFRCRSPENVLSEIFLRYREGYRVIDFEDDNISFLGDGFKRLLRLLILAFPRGDVRFTAMNGISYHSLDGETLRLMKRAGFTHLNLSLVSANPGVLSRVRRPHGVARFLEVVEQGRALGFDMTAYLILGLPCETLEEMIRTLALLARLPVRIGASLFYLTPGSPMALEFPEIAPEDMLRSRSTAMALETEYACRDDLYTLFVAARVLNFLKGLRGIQGCLPLKRAIDHARTGRPRDGIGGDILQRLFTEKILYASTHQGLEPLPRFKANLFFRVLESAGSIRILQNGIIDCTPLPRPDDF
ncbi:MAG: B12-binding domain-containing radical SAM protein [Deltaproteobacteria bacterium]|nr:B12-binding domain-containing radical SAM protein [Deltaproteobacteria bacterium]